MGPDWNLELRLRLANNFTSNDLRFLDYGELGNFSVAGFEMILARHLSHYLITYYLPSGLFVMVSWISFLIPPEIVPGRMSLLVTLFLVLVNIFNNITTNTPKAEGKGSLQPMHKPIKNIYKV